MLFAFVFHISWPGVVGCLYSCSRFHVLLLAPFPGVHRYRIIFLQMFASAFPVPSDKLYAYVRGPIISAYSWFLFFCPSFSFGTARPTNSCLLGIFDIMSCVSPSALFVFLLYPLCGAYGTKNVTGMLLGFLVVQL